jgi:aminoglycoside phosphotransferase (APT) family kinase protein
LISLGETGEFFHLTKYAEGTPYAADLHRISEATELVPEDEDRATTLAEYLAEIHAVKHVDATVYRRRIRDLVGHGEGIMGILDNYPSDFSIAPPTRLKAIETQCLNWRWRIKTTTHRLSQVHGDFHPWNVLFQEGTDFALLDRSRGAWGEPADDVSSMSINYIFFSLRQYGELAGPFRRLYDLFWDRYLDHARDEETLTVIQPFYAWRALVLASPVWYPNLDGSVREALFHFIERVLETERFDPRGTSDYLP